MAGWICLNYSRYFVNLRKCRWCRSRMRSGDLFPGPIGTEPFGLVLIEALACGTPVLAYRRGSIPEIIEDKVTGFVCESLDEMTAAIQHISEIDRRQCRVTFEQRFSAERMAQDYLRVYEQAIGSAYERETVERETVATSLESWPTL